MPDQSEFIKTDKFEKPELSGVRQEISAFEDSRVKEMLSTLTEPKLERIDRYFNQNDIPFGVIANFADNDEFFAAVNELVKADESEFEELAMDKMIAIIDGDDELLAA